MTKNEKKGLVAMLKKQLDRSTKTMGRERSRCSSVLLWLFDWCS
jgi:hypothetical protein